MPVILTAEWLTRQSFAPFGDVIETDGARHFTINSGFTERYHDLAEIDVADQGGRPILSIFRSRPLPQPIEIEFLERHPLGSQAFVPLAPRPFLILVAARPRADDLRLFTSCGQQGVSYHKGVWHYPLLALGAESDFLVIDRGGEGGNCEVARIEGPSIWLQIDVTG